jgi:predicted permease
MIRSFFKLYTLDLGVETGHLLTMRTTLPERKYKTPAERLIFYETLLPRLRAVPGVRDVTLATAPPMSGGDSRSLEIEGRPAPDPARLPEVTTMFVSPGYFATLGLAVREGRALRDADGNPGSEAVVVNTRFATQYFPGEDVLGKRVRLARSTPRGVQPEDAPSSTWVTIVGVVPVVRQRNLQEVEADAVAYMSYKLQPQAGTALLARTEGDPSSAIAAFRQAVQSVDQDQPIYDVRTMDDTLAQSRWPFRVFGSLFTIFALIALVLSAVGIYAVTAYSVTQRTQEIGVRMALGAQAGQVSWLILRQGLVQLAIGLAIGLGGALLVSRAMEVLLVQMTPTDPLTFAAISALLTVITLAACLVPARRATRLDPLVALRE